MPTAVAAAKKAIIIPMVLPMSEADPLVSRPMNRESSTTPIMSSRMAAAIMDIPTFELSLPSSLSAATVMLTEVAASIVP